MARYERAFIGLAAAALLACVTVSPARGADYATDAARRACRSAGTCTVIDQTGEHESPCWPSPGGPELYPGDPKWPFEKGVCDTVAQMNGDTVARIDAFSSSAGGR
ncbi:MAG TPA: hypothetical protein VFD92_04175 [Candidatus Binatia bacterium]|nr:hypothetical protein [Candidatus Binatia bacterium]